MRSIRFGSVALMIGLVFGMGHTPQTGAAVDPVQQAKAVVKSDENFIQARNVDGAMSCFAADVVLLFAGTPLQTGKAAVRAMYEAHLQSDPPKGEHHYEGGVAIGDLVFLHGVYRAPATPRAPATESNFMFTFRKGPDGRYRYWRVASAPAGH